LWDWLFVGHFENMHNFVSDTVQAEGNQDENLELMALENAPLNKIDESMVLEAPEVSQITSTDDDELGSGQPADKLEDVLLEVNNEAAETEAVLD
jgi:hypothetical protein